MNEHSFKGGVKMSIEKKKRIRAAAVEVISEKGFYNTRMQDIADEAGLAVGTIYNYFSNKDDVLEYIFKMEMERRMEIMQELKSKDISTKKLITLFLEKHFETLVRNPHLGRVIVREKDFSKHSESSKIKEFMENIIQKFENVFLQGIKNGEIIELDPHLMAVFFFGALQGIIEHSLTAPEVELLQQGPDFIMQRIDHIFIK